MAQDVAKARSIINIMGKVDHMFFLHDKVITRDVQHNLVTVDIDKKQEKKTEWKVINTM